MTLFQTRRCGVVLAGGLVAACGVPAAQAVPTATKDASTFDYFYDFEETPVANPTSGDEVLSVFDLYNNSTGAAGADGVQDFVAGAGIPPVHADGVLGVRGNFYNLTWDASNQQTQADTPGAAGYTIEFRARASLTDGGVNGTGSYMAASDTISTGGFRIIENTAAGVQEVYYGAVNGDTTPETTVPIGQFSDIRIVAEPDAAVSGPYMYKNTMYVNGDLVASDEPITFATSPIRGRLIFGAFGSGFSGFFEMESLAWTAGAFAPVVGGTGIDGDYNDSGQVEQGDLDLVLSNWGLDTVGIGVPSGWINDLPDGLIEQTELDGVLSNWGASSAPDFSGSSVPEPTTLALIGGLGLLAARRRA